MEHLYIVGNGFDIHHNIPSKYSDFYKWLEANEPELLSNIQDYFVGCSDPTWWSEFEQELASLDTLNIIHEKAIEYYPNIASDDFRDSDWYGAEYAVEVCVNKMYDDIEVAFSKWIKSLPKGNPQKKIFINNTSWFLNFNYTYTLETLYGINANNILHIHGKVGMPDEKLILGHGTSSKELNNKIKLTYDDDSTMYFTEDRARDTIIYEIACRKKDVERIIQNNEKWFESLLQVKYLHFYGFSFSDIDMPYISKILDSVNKDNINIEFSFYEEKDKERISHVVNKYSISRDQYHLIELSELEI